MFDSSLFVRLLLLAVATLGVGCGATCSNTMVHLWQDSSGHYLPDPQPAQLYTTCDSSSPTRETLAYCKTMPTPDDGQWHYCKTQYGGAGGAGGYNGWSSGALFGPTQWIDVTVH